MLRSARRSSEKINEIALSGIMAAVAMLSAAGTLGVGREDQMPARWPDQQACLERPGVDGRHVVVAFDDLAAAHAARAAALQGGSRYAAAKVGIARGSKEWAATERAEQQVLAAEARVRALCG